MKRRNTKPAPFTKELPALVIKQSNNGGYIADVTSLARGVIESFAFETIDSLIAFLRANDREARKPEKAVK